MKTGKLIFGLAVCALFVFTGCKEQFTLPAEELTRDGYFTLKETNETGKYGPVIILPERHNSRLIQAEFAWALDMMIANGLRSIALEGMYAGEKISAQKIKYRTDDEKHTVLLAMLERGEIKAPEFMYLLRGSPVFGIEDKVEYAVKTEDEDIFAYAEYLELSIVIDQGEEIYLQGVEALENEEIDIDTFFSLNPWTFETYEIVNSKIWPADKGQRLRELERKVDQSNYGVTGKTRAGFRRVISFYETADKRSLTMAENVYNRLRNKNEAVAMIIGAAHTQDIAEYFEKNNVSYYVLEPSGYTKKVWSDLTNDEYKQKDEQKSIFVNKQIDRFFNSSRNSRPRITVDSFRNTRSLYLLTIRMNSMVSSWPLPEPPKTNLSSDDLRIVWETVEFIDTGDVIFGIENKRGERLYVRTMRNDQTIASGNIVNVGSIQHALHEMVKRLSQIDEGIMSYEQRIQAYSGVIEAFNIGGNYTAVISPIKDTLREIKNNIPNID